MLAKMHPWPRIVHMSMDVAPTPLSLDVAEEIRAVMGRRKMTGAQMAKAIGVSPAWVSYRINGQVAPTVDDLHAIAAVLGVSVMTLLPTSVREIAVAGERPGRVLERRRARAAASVATEEHARLPAHTLSRPRDRRPSVRTDSRRPPSGDRRPPSGSGRTARVRPPMGK